MNLLHDISPGEPSKMNVVVEINKGSKTCPNKSKAPLIVLPMSIAEPVKIFPE